MQYVRCMPQGFPTGNSSNTQAARANQAAHTTQPTRQPPNPGHQAAQPTPLPSKESFEKKELENDFVRAHADLRGYGLGGGETFKFKRN